MIKPRNTARISTAKRFAQIEKISIMGITERTSPLGLHIYANAYLDAARALPLPTIPFDPVRPFLICHSIELGLKAFLSLQGASMLELADGSHGHNLEAILEKATKQHLRKHVGLTDIHIAAVRKANLYYAGKVFEYPAIGEALSAYPSMPAIDTLFEVAIILVDSLRELCLEAK